MTAPCYYDDALPRFAELVEQHLGAAALTEHLFLRDASGRLTLVLRGESPREQIGEDRLRRLTDAVSAQLGPYVDACIIATPTELFDDSLAGGGYHEHLPNGRRVRLIERWLVGNDWQSPPLKALEGAPPIVAFVSHKGGVGRSTALAVAAAHFAARGRDVLALDLDLEAPGLGTMLLPDDRTPRYGAIDYYIENGLRPLDDAFYGDLLGTSPLTTDRGIIHVVPAAGSLSASHPQNMLGKIARAYLDDPAPDGATSFLGQTRALIRALAERRRYDLILIDTRAGLHESTATALLGLGAELLLFGVDTPQTFHGYRFLLAHLARFAPETSGDDDWRYRLQMVHAKASADPKRARAFDDRAYTLLQGARFYDPAPEDPSDEAFSFSLDEVEAPHRSWRILSDSNYFEFDPLSAPEVLTQPLYSRTFGSFLAALEERVNLTDAPAD
jgi:hypothetical protein